MLSLDSVVDARNAHNKESDMAAVNGKTMMDHLMLGRLSIGCWEGRIQDKAQAAKVEKDAGAIAGAAIAGKRLGAGVIEHADLTKKITCLRGEWTKTTTAWDDGRGGWRTFAAAGADDLIVKVGEWEREYWASVEAFCAVWPTVLANRQFDLGDLFDPKDFPSPKKMRRKFYWSFETSMLANPNDIRLAKGVSEDAAERLVQMNTEAITRKFEAAANEAATRLFKVVQSMHDTMAVPHGEKGGKFNDSKLDNIVAVADLMPTLNITGNPELAKLARMAKKLAIQSPDELRGDPVKREKAAKDAGALAQSIASLFDVTADEDL